MTTAYRCPVCGVPGYRMADGRRFCLDCGQSFDAGLPASRERMIAACRQLESKPAGELVCLDFRLTVSKEAGLRLLKAMLEEGDA